MAKTYRILQAIFTTAVNDDVIVRPQGGIPRPRNINRVLKKALKEAKIPTDMDLHLHNLRHSGSTWSARAALDAGGDPAIIVGWIKETTALWAATQTRHLSEMSEEQISMIL